MKNFVLLLSLISLLSACQKDAELLAPDTTNNTTDSSANENEATTYPYYFTAEIDGKDVSYKANDLFSRYSSGAYIYYSALGWEDYNQYEGTMMQNIFSPDTNAIYVSILKYFNHEPSLDERWAMITLGDHQYGLSQLSSATIDGASIIFFDASGKEWRSESGSQSGSTFTVTELIENDESLYGMIFTAKFNCKVYDEAGNSIELKNATIRGRVYGN